MHLGHPDSLDLQTRLVHRVHTARVQGEDRVQSQSQVLDPSWAGGRDEGLDRQAQEGAFGVPSGPKLATSARWLSNELRLHRHS